MERKIEEIFEYNGEWYQCLKSARCYECVFKDKNCDNIRNLRGYCIAPCRSDRTDVHFKKLKKDGEPYYSKYFGKFYQKYITYIPAVGHNFKIRVEPVEHVGRNEIFIEIKQNKEDMEEKKLNLKPFDLEAAKQGHPVCCRNGRKARIICFDYKGDTNAYPILALISTSNLSGVPSEIIAKYTEDGRYAKYNNVENDEDLMMLPEKRSGWIVIHKEAIYDKETAEKIARETTANVIRIQKIEWEE